MAEPKTLGDVEHQEILLHPQAILFEKTQSNDSETALISDLPRLGLNQLKNLARKRQKRSALIFAIAVTDVLAIICAFIIATILYLGKAEMQQAYNVLWAAVPIYFAIALNIKAFRTNVLTSLWKSASRAIMSLLLATSSILLILFFFKTSAEFSRVMFGLGTISAIIFMILTRSAINRFSKSYVGASPYADLCIYDEICKNEESDSSIDVKEFGLVADPSDAGAVSRLGELVSGMDRVIVHCPQEKQEAWVFMLRSFDVEAEIVVPELQAIDPLAIKRRSGKISLLISAGQLRWDQKLVKRVFDILFLSAALPIAIPIILVFAAAVKIESPGPAFFRQERIGLGNRKFRIWKLRSMRFDLQDNTASKLTQRDDPRITKVGAFIRKTSVDELPQIFNVLAGDMSVVGPRPHAEAALAGKSLYWEVDNNYWKRHVIKPGITGLAQVRGHRGNTFQEEHLKNRLNSDLEYVANWSFFGDVKIILQTFVVLFHKNAF